MASATVPQNTGARKRRCPVGFSHRSWDRPDLAAENRPAVETAGDRISLAADTQERWLKPPPSVSCPGGFGHLGVIAGRSSRRCQFKHPLGVIPGWGFNPRGPGIQTYHPQSPNLSFRGGGFNPRGPGIQTFRVMPCWHIPHSAPNCHSGVGVLTPGVPESSHIIHIAPPCHSGVGVLTPGVPESRRSG